MRNLIVLSLLLAPYVSFATDDCRGNSCNSGGGGDIDITGGDIDVTTGDVVVNPGDVNVNPVTEFHNKSKVLSLGRSSFDTDINDCRESTAFDTPIFGRQNVRLNPWCAAEVYDAKGMYKMAAILRCDIREIKEHFATKDECLEANTYNLPEAPETTPPVDWTYISEVDSRLEEEEERRTSLEERLAELEAKREADAKRAASYARSQRAFEEEQKQQAMDALSALEKYK